MNSKDKKNAINEIKFVKDITVGSINPNNPISDEGRTEQMELLNRCLSDYPRGMILGWDITIGRYMLGQHELTMQKTTYHVGFARKPSWIAGSEISSRAAEKYKVN